MDLFIIAGPNGAGKTTFAREFLPNYADCKNFVNADLIAQGMAPFLLRLPHSVRGR
jgi:predicted ABC-type ATPase